MIIQSLSKMWPDGIPFNRILLFRSDGASYSTAAYATLHELFSKMIHITCVVHGLNRVAEKVRFLFPDVNALIASVKAVFFKAHERKRAFHEMFPDVLLPPEPVITRFSSWLKAVRYYAIHLKTITPLLESLDPEESVFKLLYLFIILVFYF